MINYKYNSISLYIIDYNKKLILTNLLIIKSEKKDKKYM